jgi:hypothetical protein
MPVLQVGKDPTYKGNGLRIDLAMERVEVFNYPD